MLALAVAWVLFVPAAGWLAHHDVGSVKGPLHETALDNARGGGCTLGAGLFAAGALLFTARNFTLSREGQVTDRYTKAIEQLGSDKLDVRIGGIYALERVAWWEIAARWCWSRTTVSCWTVSRPSLASMAWAKRQCFGDYSQWDAWQRAQQVKAARSVPAESAAPVLRKQCRAVDSKNTNP